MATTKIWDVKSHLSQLIAYVSNVEKTVEKFDDATLKVLISYGVDDLKTEERKYVTAVNCTTADASEVMASLNKQTQSKSNTVAYQDRKSTRLNSSHGC